MIGIRGAVQARANEREEIHGRTRELLVEILRRNELRRADIVSAFFTMTPDLDADFPAHAARRLGWTDVPMLGAQETEVPGALERVIRVLLHVDQPGPARHVYLGAAAGMRPDLGSEEAPSDGADPSGPSDPKSGESQPDEDENRAPPVAGGTAPVTPTYGSLLIVGLGLMGGSAALALRDRRLFREILGHDRLEDARELARRSGAVSEAFADPAEAIGRAEAVLLAQPIRELTAWLERWSDELRPGTIVLDVGSTKETVAAAMDRLPTDVEAVGMHPMAGSERSGMRAARPELYRGATWALVETERTGDSARELAAALVRALEGEPLWMTAERHDRTVARTSHLPYLVSCALTLHAAGDEDPAPREVRRLLGPGLRDMTRLAAADPAMMADILATNWPRIRDEVGRFGTELQELTALLAGRIERAEPVLGRSVDARRRLFGS